MEFGVPAMVAMPVMTNTAAAIQRISFIGTFRVSASPTRTAGTLATIMPTVVPLTTAIMASHFREEERNQRGDECPSAVWCGFIVQRIGMQRPQPEANEQQADDPGQQQWRQPCGRKDT
jgi:hypothetical protein